MSFTKRFEKALRRKKRSNRPGAEPVSRMQVRRMTNISVGAVRPIWATAVKLKDPLRVGVWVWKEGAPDFLVAGEEHDHNSAEYRIGQFPLARVISPEQFHQRTKHLSAAAATNGHTKEGN